MSRDTTIRVLQLSSQGVPLSKLKEFVRARKEQTLARAAAYNKATVEKRSGRTRQDRVASAANKLETKVYSKTPAGLSFNQKMKLINIADKLAYKANARATGGSDHYTRDEAGRFA